MAGKNNGSSYRSAKSGRYVTKAHGAAHPRTTVKEAPGKVARPAEAIVVPSVADL